MTSAIVQEILEKFQQLDPATKKHILHTMNDLVELDQTFDYLTWQADVDRLQAGIRARIGNDATVGALSLLDELREESS